MDKQRVVVFSDVPVYFSENLLRLIWLDENFIGRLFQQGWKTIDLLLVDSNQGLQFLLMERGKGVRMHAVLLEHAP